MKVKIGENIKLLRKKKEITQDYLAEYLGITAQAVSRWESEQCYPDIEMIPAIADFFDITIDELMSVEQSKKEAKIQEFIEKANHAQCNGKFSEAIDIYRIAVSQYPTNYNLQAHLACAIGCMDNGIKIPVESAKEVIGICNRILDDCMIDSIRNRALHIMIWVYYRHLDDLETALTVANRLPKLFECRELAIIESLKIRIPNEDAKNIVFNMASAMLIAFDNPGIAYCNNRETITSTLIKELQNLSQQ